jgi:tetratricopeptide (TPR) repeat protein
MSFDINWEGESIINHAEEYFIKANSLYIVKNYNEAIENYDKAIEADSSYTKAYIQKGILLTELNRTNEAFECYDQAIALDSTNSEALASKASMLEGMKRYHDALECYNKAIEADPNNPDLYVSKGLTLDLLNRFEDAIECYDLAIDLDPNYPDVYNNKGVDLKELRRYEDAMTCFTRALELDPNYSDAFVNAGNVLFSLKMYDAALTCYERAIEIEPNFISAYTSKGITLNLVKRLEEAIEVFDKALELMPNYPEAYNNKSLSLYELGKFNEAMECLNTSIQINQKNSKAYHYKGVVLFKLRKLEEAIKSLRKAIELNNKNPIVYLTEAVYLKHLDRYDEAIQLIATARGLITQDVPFSYNNPDEKNIGELKQLLEQVFDITGVFKNIYTGLKKKGVSNEEFKRLKAENGTLEAEFVTKYTLEQELPEDMTKLLLIQLDKSKNLQVKLENEQAKVLERNLLRDSNAAIEFNIKGLVAGASKKFKEAIDNFNKAIEVYPDYEEAIYNKGLILLRQGKFTEAIECFNLVLEVNAKNVKSYQNKAIAFYKQQSIEEALESIESAIKFSPKNPLLLINKAILQKEQLNFKDSLALIRKAKEASTEDFKLYDFSEDSIRYIEQVIEVIFDLTFEISELDTALGQVSDDPTGVFIELLREYNRIRKENVETEMDFIFKCCIEVDFTKEYNVILQAQMEEIKKLNGRTTDKLGQLKVNSENETQYHTACQLFLSKDYTKAIETLNEILNVDNPQRKAYCLKALCEICSNKFDKTERSLRKAEETGTDYVVFYYKALLKCKQGKNDQAYKYVNKAHAMKDNYVMISLLKATLMKILNSDYEDALAIQKKALGDDTTTQDDYYNNFTVSKQVIQSINDLTGDMIKLSGLINPTLEKEYENLQKQILTAELEYIVATALGEKTEDYRKRTTSFRESIKDILKRTIKLNEPEPEQIVTENNTTKNEAIDKSCITTEVAFKQNPLSAGIALFEEEKYDEAINYFNKVLDADRNNILIYHYKSIALYYLQKHDDAIYCLSQTSEFINPLLLINKAIIRKAEGSFGEALRLFTNANEFDESEYDSEHYKLQSKDIKYIKNTLVNVVDTTEQLEKLSLHIKSMKNKAFVGEYNSIFEQNMRTDIRFLTNITIGNNYSENFNRVYLIQQEEVRKLFAQCEDDTFIEKSVEKIGLEEIIDEGADGTKGGAKKVRVDRRNLKVQVRETSKVRISLHNLTSEMSSICIGEDFRKQLKHDLSKNSILRDESRTKNREESKKVKFEFGNGKDDTLQNTYMYNTNEEIVKNMNFKEEAEKLVNQDNHEDEINDINKIMITEHKEKKIETEGVPDSLNVSEDSVRLEVEDFEQKLKRDYNNLSMTLMHNIIDYYYGYLNTFNNTMTTALGIQNSTTSIKETFYDFDKVLGISAFITSQRPLEVNGIRAFSQMLRKLDIDARAQKFIKLFPNKLDRIISRIAYLLIDDIKIHIERFPVNDIKAITKLEVLQDKYHDITEFNDPRILKQSFKYEFFKLGVQDAEKCIDLLLDNQGDAIRIDEECVRVLRDIYKNRVGKNTGTPSTADGVKKATPGGHKKKTSPKCECGCLVI